MWIGGGAPAHPSQDPRERALVLEEVSPTPPQPGQRHCQRIDDLGHLGAGERHQPGVVLEHSLAPTFTVGIYLGPCSAGVGTVIMGVRGQRWGASVQLCKPT